MVGRQRRVRRRANRSRRRCDPRTERWGELDHAELPLSTSSKLRPGIDAGVLDRLRSRLRARLGPLPGGVQRPRSDRKNVVTSAERSSGASSAAKCPPRDISVQAASPAFGQAPHEREVRAVLQPGLWDLLGASRCRVGRSRRSFSTSSGTLRLRLERRHLFANSPCGAAGRARAPRWQGGPT